MIEPGEEAPDHGPERGEPALLAHSGPLVCDSRRAAAISGHVIGKDGAMTARDTALDLIKFIDASPSPFSRWVLRPARMPGSTMWPSSAYWSC